MSAVRKWQLRKPDNLVVDIRGRTWTADGLVPFPVRGWNFARVEKARIGWWVYPQSRFVTMDPNSFEIVYMEKTA